MGSGGHSFVSDDTCRVIVFFLRKQSKASASSSVG